MIEVYTKRTEAVVGGCVHSLYLATHGAISTFFFPIIFKMITLVPDIYVIGKQLYSLCYAIAKLPYLTPILGSLALS